MGIGLDSSDRNIVNRCYLDNKTPGFVYWECADIENSFNHASPDNADEFSEGDAVSLEVNTKEKVITFQVNDSKEIIMNETHLDWTRNYYFAITNYNEISSITVQLTNFTQNAV